MKNDDEIPQPNLLGRLVSRGYAIIAARPVVTLGIVVALVFLLIYGPAFLLGIKEALTTPKIERQKHEAATEKTAAEVDKTAAAEAQTERKAEDERRTTEIEPQRRRAASRLDEARQTRQTLERTYEKNLQNPRRPPVDDDNLRRRNCSDLAGILPGQRVAGCQ
jgi:hypothetical protein